MKNGKFDYAKLAAHILSKREKDNVTFRQMAKETKLTVSSCHRAETAIGGLTMESVIILCNWVDCSVQYFITTKIKTHGKSKSSKKEPA